MREARRRSRLVLPAGAALAGLLVLLVLAADRPTPLPPGPAAPEPMPAGEPARPQPPPPDPTAVSPAPAPEERAAADGEPAEAGADPREDSPEMLALKRAAIEAIRRAGRLDASPAEPLGAVAPDPPRVATADLVSGGLERLDGVAALVGEREPAVDPGVPIAISGRVTEKESGLPVAGAAVVLRSTFYERALVYDHSLAEIARVLTDADGEFRIERLDVDPVHFGRGGLVYLSVSDPDHAPLPARSLGNVSPGWKSRLDDLVVTRERHVVRGRVIDRWEGKPVAGARILATGNILPIEYPKDQREALFLSAPTATTDEEGRFVLENVGAGSQWISVHGGDDCAGYQMIRVPAKGKVVIRSRQIRGRIAGKVLDSLGRPIALAVVAGGDNTTHSFADGSFVLENFRGDVVTLSVAHAEFDAVSLPDVENGSEGLVIRMEGRWPEVRFRVTNEDSGEPVVTVFAALVFEGSTAPPMPTSPYRVAESGVHAVRVPEGVTQVVVGAEGYGRQTFDMKGVRGGDVIDVRLRPE